ncbi:MAG: hypothetical protein ACI7YS_17715 [Flavobacterium sp.]
MKKIMLITILIALTSCNNNSEFEQKISQLEKTNDSLKTILDTLKTKFIFDHAFVRHIPADHKNLKIGEKYTGEFFFVAYNDEDRILFTQEKNATTFDTLTVKRKTYAAYVYETTAKKDSNNYIFRPLIKNKTALKFKNSMYGSGIIISDLKIVK